MVWYWVNPLTFIKEFFALRDHARAVSQLQLLSCFTFNNVSVIIALWCSQMPLFQVDSAAVLFLFQC